MVSGTVWSDVTSVRNSVDGWTWPRGEAVFVSVMKKALTRVLGVTHTKLCDLFIFYF